MNSKITFDRNSAKDFYDWLLNLAIWYEKYILNDFYSENHQRIDILNIFFERIEDFEKCYWITEIKKSHILGDTKLSKIDTSKSKNLDERNKLLYKSILLNIIYYPKENFDMRFCGLDNQVLKNLIHYFENKKDFEKCYWLDEIRKHFEFECMMNICRSIPD